jgi:hypothetical protein
VKTVASAGVALTIAASISTTSPIIGALMKFVFLTPDRGMLAPLYVDRQGRQFFDIHA